MDLTHIATIIRVRPPARASVPNSGRVTDGLRGGLGSSRTKTLRVHGVLLSAVHAALASAVSDA